MVFSLSLFSLVQSDAIALLLFVSQRFMASHPVEIDWIHLLILPFPGPHDHRLDPGVHDHLGAEEAWPYPREISCLHVIPGEVKGAFAGELACLEQCVHLCVDAPAFLVIGSGGDPVLQSPAPFQLSAVFLLSGGAGIPGGDDGVEPVHDDRTEVAPQAGSLVRGTEGKIKKVLVSVCPH